MNTPNNFERKQVARRFFLLLHAKSKAQGFFKNKPFSKAILGLTIGLNNLLFS